MPGATIVHRLAAFGPAVEEIFIAGPEDRELVRSER